MTVTASNSFFSGNVCMNSNQLLAAQNYVTGLNYITATPYADLNMNYNYLLFNGTGIIYFYSNGKLNTT